MNVLFGILLALAAAADSHRSVSVEDVSWLRGCWERASRSSTVEEQWMAPRGGCMVGVSRTVRGDTLSGFEIVIIREQGERLIYEAHPSGQPAASFLAIEVGDSTVVFENPDHDFPQRIGYRRSASDSLIAWIEGDMDGETRRVNFPYARVRCAED